ncbi:uncharacterized protein LOC129570325 [Sitodiplosis mosellana]|uniref:uncharacterized protein LOC129570325 n=1 Tax=Sitodiplosis mosellana TaxID=263140 RepID=UPI002444BE38|nr:uncharacterized protein LOC129570325 [Sitodiplosis mosellana]
MKIPLFIALVLIAMSWQSVSAADPVVKSDNSSGNQVNQTSNGDEMTLTVAPQTVDCFGPFPQKCLRVKDGSTDDWTYFYSHINGFNHESGYEYVLKVKTEDVPNPPADGSSVKYTLLEQVSKTKKINP